MGIESMNTSNIGYGKELKTGGYNDQGLKNKDIMHERKPPLYGVTEKQAEEMQREESSSLIDNNIIYEYLSKILNVPLEKIDNDLVARCNEARNRMWFNTEIEYNPAAVALNTGNDMGTFIFAVKDINDTDYFEIYNGILTLSPNSDPLELGTSNLDNKTITDYLVNKYPKVFRYSKEEDKLPSNLPEDILVRYFHKLKRYTNNEKIGKENKDDLNHIKTTIWKYLKLASIEIKEEKEFNILLEDIKSLEIPEERRKELEKSEAIVKGRMKEILMIQDYLLKNKKLPDGYSIR